MSFFCDVVTFDKDDSGTDPFEQTVSHASGTAKVIIIFGVKVTATGASSATDFCMCFGFSDGTTERAATFISEDDQATSDTDRSQSATDVVTVLDNSMNIIDSGTITDLSDGAFKITWNPNTTNAFKFTAIVIGGTDITSVEIGSHQVDSETGAHSEPVTSPTTANADFGLFFNVREATALDSITSNAYLSIGACDSSGNQWSYTCGEANAQGTTRADRMRSNTQCIGFLSAVGTGVSVGQGSVAFDAEGYDITWDAQKGAGQYRIHHVLIKGGQWECGNFLDVVGSTGFRTPATAFQPVGLMMVGSNMVNSVDVQAQAFLSIGAADGTTESFAQTGAKDAENEAWGATSYSETKIISKFTSVLQSTGPTISVVANFDSFNSGDFKLEYTTVHASADQEWGWFVCAGNAAGGATPKGPLGLPLHGALRGPI